MQSLSFVDRLLLPLDHRVQRVGQLFELLASQRFLDLLLVGCQFSLSLLQIVERFLDLLLSLTGVAVDHCLLGILHALSGSISGRC